MTKRELDRARFVTTLIGGFFVFLGAVLEVWPDDDDPDDDDEDEEDEWHTA